MASGDVSPLASPPSLKEESRIILDFSCLSVFVLLPSCSKEMITIQESIDLQRSTDDSY